MSLDTSRAVGLHAACDRLGVSYRTGKRRLAAGTFPIPALPKRHPREHWKFSSLDIDKYLADASVADARVRRRAPHTSGSPTEATV